MSWGYLASNGQRFLRAAWWMAIFPAVTIVLAVLGLNLLGDALNDFLNPLATRGDPRSVAEEAERGAREAQRPAEVGAAI